MQVRKRKKPVGSSWQMDETYIKVNGIWMYLYRAVDSMENTKRTRPMLGFKSFRSAKITIAGIERIHMIKKRQIVGANDNVSVFENFVTMMA